MNRPGFGRSGQISDVLGQIRPGRRSELLPGLHVFSPFGGRGLALLQARKGTRWGVNGDSDPSGSARQQQQKSRRSTGSPRAGSEGDGTLATGGRLGPLAEVRGSTGVTVKD